MNQLAIPLASTSNLINQPNQPPLKNNAGTPPDLSERFKLKSKYAKLQRKYQHSLLIRKDLILEMDEKEEKVQKLQDEVNLVIDQIYDSDYIHLAPQEEEYFSDSEGDEEEEEKGGKEENGDREGRTEETMAIEGSMGKAVNGHKNGKTKRDSSPERSIKRPRLEIDEVVES